MKRTFVALVTDKPGVLNQVASFSAGGPSILNH